MSPAELLSPDTRVSLQQVLMACANATRLSRDSSLAFRAGESMHVASLGMYGFAILSSTDFRRTMSFCERYHVLSSPLVTLRFREDHGEGAWSVDPLVQTPISDPLYRFIVEMQMGIILSLMRDVMDGSFSPRKLRSLSRSRTTLDSRNTSRNARSRSAGQSMSSFSMRGGSTPAQSLATGQPTRWSNLCAIVSLPRCRNSRAPPGRSGPCCCRTSADSLL